MHVSVSPCTCLSKYVSVSPCTCLSLCMRVFLSMHVRMCANHEIHAYKSRDTCVCTHLFLVTGTYTYISITPHKQSAPPTPGGILPPPPPPPLLYTPAASSPQISSPAFHLGVYLSPPPLPPLLAHWTRAFWAFLTCFLATRHPWVCVCVKERERVE
jgi:hypothetical protein